MPDDVVVRCGLRADLELDRPLLRRLRSELRRAEALAVASRALRRRDLSRRRLAERLEVAGIAPTAERSALQALTEARILDDTRLAETRAAALADRGWGDAAIAARLDSEGIAEGEARVALAGLPAEALRAEGITRGLSRPKAWALLARRGFDEETIGSVVGCLDEEASGGLG